MTWRRPQPLNVDRMLLVSPSPDLVARLPNAKIPDRRDFLTMPPDARVAAWRQVVAMCGELADEFEDVLANDRLAERVRPFRLAAGGANTGG